MRRFFGFLLIASVALAFAFNSGSTVLGQSKDHFAVQLQGFAWQTGTLSALLIVAENESWWSAADLNSALRAIGQWNEAISYFASNYSQYSYLSSVSIQPTVSNNSQLGFDLYINWTEFPLSNTADEVGLSSISPDSVGVIRNSTINLSTHTNHGDAISEGDAQNVALHEIGHSLGLGHSNYTGDLMYSTYTMSSPAEEVSTLDVYGVAAVFAWELNTSDFYPISGWLKEDSVVLPSDISYQGLPVSSQNARPQTLANNPVVQFLVFMFEVLIHPEILAIVIVIIIIFAAIAFVPKKKKRVKAGS